MASSRSTKLGPKQQEAIEALLLPGSVEDAARKVGITTKKLSGWMKNPEFMAAYRAAKRAEYRQSMAYLGQGATQILKSILHTMYHSKKPALRLRAAREITLLANEANEIEEFIAGVADAERMIRAAQSRCRSTSAGLKARPLGHGAKRPCREEQAIVALLAQRSVAEAARTLDVKPQTLRLWMQDPAFNARYAKAACAVYGPSMSLAQQHLGDAVVIIKNFSVDSAVPEETRFQAAIYRAAALRANVIAHLESRLSWMEPGSTTGEPQVVSQAIDSSLHERLRQIKSRLQQASGQSAIRRMIFVHSVDGRAAGSSVAGPDGRHRWWDPPEGFKKDDLVEEDKSPLRDVVA